MGFTFLFICLLLSFLATFDAVAPSYLIHLIMKVNEYVKYEAPEVEIIEVEVEKGFAGSTGAGSDFSDPE